MPDGPPSAAQGQSPAAAGSSASRTPTALRKLRPAKVRNAVKRRWFERVMHATPLERASVIDLGSPYGGWTLPEGVIESSWVCYCVGAGGDISLDVELLDRFGATVRSFDAVSDYVELARVQADGRERFSAHHAAIARRDGPLRVQWTHDAGSSSVSSAGLYESDRYVEVPGRSIRSLMAELGDERIDLLKLDIEGGEYELLPTLDLAGLGVKVFATQLHHTSSVRSAKRLIADLRAKGYDPVAMRSAVKVAFLRRDLRLTAPSRDGGA
jgi:FkbM family methyltransferase